MHIERSGLYVSMDTCFNNRFLFGKLYGNYFSFRLPTGQIYQGKKNEQIVKRSLLEYLLGITMTKIPYDLKNDRAVV